MIAHVPADDPFWDACVAPGANRPASPLERMVLVCGVLRTTNVQFALRRKLQSDDRCSSRDLAKTTYASLRTTGLPSSTPALGDKKSPTPRSRPPGRVPGGFTEPPHGGRIVNDRTNASSAPFVRRGAWCEEPARYRCEQQDTRPPPVRSAPAAAGPDPARSLRRTRTVTACCRGAPARTPVAGSPAPRSRPNDAHPGRVHSPRW